MKHQATRELFGYWNSLRGERTAPQRSEIDPAAIRNVLADTFMLDVDQQQRYQFRLAGTRVNGLFDSEQKGRSFLDLWRAEERRNVAAVLMTVADGACPVVAGGVVAPLGQEECAVELLFLPLRHYGKTHSRILGLLKSASQPAWLGLLPVGPLSLRSLRIIDDAESEAQRMPKPIPTSMAIGQNAINPDTMDQETHAVRFGASAISAKAAQSRPYLRLIQGGL
jgi:hypothetical protein